MTVELTPPPLTETREAIAQIVEQINPEWWSYVSGTP